MPQAATVDLRENFVEMDRHNQVDHNKELAESHSQPATTEADRQKGPVEMEKFDDFEDVPKLEMSFFSTGPIDFCF